MTKKDPRRTKVYIVHNMGGHCILCGYNRCEEALDLHHLNPEVKAFSISEALEKKKYTWQDIHNELNKCVMLCKNCHMEVTYHITDIPKDMIQPRTYD